MYARIPILFIALILMTANVDSATIVKVDIKGEINEGTVVLVESAFKKAEEINADAVLITIDTPGGLLLATKKIVSMILDSDVPVITYVYPPGAFSASAGSFILISGNIAAMANGTSVGAATPISCCDEPRIENKTVEYVASYARSVAENRNRPADIVGKFVTESLSLSAKEAYEKGVVDVLADSPDDLFKKIDGWVVDVKGRKVKLDLKSVEVVTVKKSVKSQMFEILTNPQIAFVLFIVGLYCLIFGLMSPGVGMEVLGAICLILALFGLGALSIDYFAAILILLGILLLILELLTPTYGILGVASVVCITLGSIMLFKEPLMPKDFYRTFPMFVGGISLGVATIMTFVILKVAQLRKMKRKVGGEAMIGEIGEVIEFKDGKGLVKVRGEIWKCKSEEELGKGDEVIVIGRDGLTLFVRKHDRGGAEKGDVEVAGEDQG